MDEQELEEIRALRDADKLHLLPPEALIASIKYLAEKVLGVADIPIVEDDASAIPPDGDYGATATLVYNSRFALLLGQALLFAHREMPNLDLESDRMLSALGNGMLAASDELAGR